MKLFSTNIRLRILTIGASIGLAVAVLPGMAQAVPYTGLVVFGDSLADSGNAAIVFDNVPPPDGPRTQVPVPAGEPVFVATAPYASNRYSNGPVWVDQFAAALNLPNVPSLNGGNNFAYGGAKVGGNAFLPPPLTAQVAQFLEFNNNVADPGNLYVIEGGANDARAAFSDELGGGSVDGVLASYAAATANIIGNLSASGAEHILLANVPDLGKVPGARVLGDQASQRATEIARQFNLALETILDALPADERDNILLLDLFGLTGDIFNNGAGRGFTDVTSVCVFTQACVDNPEGVFFWDSIHPTTAGHGAIADAALLLVQDVSAEVPLPGTLWLFVPGLSLMLLARRRRRALAGATGMRNLHFS